MLALVTTWHGASVSGETYVVRCNGTAQFTFAGSDVIYPTCDGIAPVDFNDDGSNAVEVSLENSIATITVREGTTTTGQYVMKNWCILLAGVVTDECVERRQFIANPNVEVTVDVQNTDFTKATKLNAMYVVVMLTTLR